MDPSTSFGYWLRRRRKALDLTQAELARRVGCVVTTIKKLEADERRPSKQLAERLADTLAIPPGERAAFLQAARAELAADRLASPLDPPAGSPSHPRAPSPSAHVKGYVLREQLGAGGFGVVYRAEQPAVGRAVAIKIILPQYANQPTFIRRFEAEAQLVARLEHPHIVPLYDYWRERDGAYLVMRLMRGGSLEGGRASPWSLAAIVQLLAQLAPALALAHRQGVVHRDLKPANILRDEEGNVYLADFGIAKDLLAAEAQATQPDAVVGSPAYLSPEQIKQEPVTPQTDIYSLGVLLYELLSGSPPFAGLSPAERLRQQLHTPLPLLAPQRPDLPTALDAVLQQATAKQAAQRYPDVLHLLAAFQQATNSALALPLLPGELLTKRAVEAGPDALPGTPPTAGVVLGDALTRTADALLAVANPYKGLRAFGEADAADFFGRDSVTQQLLARLTEPSELARFLAVVGPSGSGKSSVVRAGLLPALRSGAVLGSDHWFIVELLPGAQPLEELEAALLRVAVNPPSSLLEQLQADERGLLRAVKRVLPEDERTELVLVIDQFEEVFTLVADEAIRQHLLNSLVTAVLDERSRLRVVLTLRADFMARPLQYADFGELLRERAVLLLPLTADELEQAIVRPAARVGVSVEPELVTAMVREVEEQPGSLPLLQYSLTELFERRDGPILTLAAYRASGGVLGALTRRADELYAELDAAQQAAARQVFLRLITLGEGVEDTRRRVRRAELATVPDDDRQLPSGAGGLDGSTPPLAQNPSSAVDTVIERYGRYRLLTFDRDPVTREPTVEVAHEALIREWGRLREWLAASRDDLRIHRRLMAAATEWMSAGRERSFLASGARLDQFAALAAGSHDGRELALNAEERAYLEASLAERAAQQAHEAAQQARESTLEQRARRRMQGLVAVLLLATIIALGLTVFAFNQRGLAQTERDTAQAAREQAERAARLASSRELAAAAISNLDVDPERSILLALQAVAVTYSVDKHSTPQAEDALHQAVLASRAQLTLSGHTGEVTSVAFNPDGTRLASAGRDGLVKIWDATSGRELLTLRRHAPTGVSWLAFSPDGTRLASAGRDASARIWDAVSGQELLVLYGHAPVGVAYVAFSSDGTRLATTGEDNTARVWDATTGQELLTLRGHTNVVVGASFNHDGSRLATSSFDGSTKVWDTATGRELLAVEGLWGTFSPDGTRLVTAIEPYTKVWDATTGQELLTLRGHTNVVTFVAFNRDGTLLATTSRDRKAIVWEAATGRQLMTLSGHTDLVSAAAFSPDGTQLATSSVDGTVKIWSLAPSQELLTLFQPSGSGSWFALSPDGSRLVMIGESNTLPQVWQLPHNPSSIGNTQSAKQLFTLDGHTAYVRGLAFSRDGSRIATASFDGTAKMWDTATGQELLTISDHSGTVGWVAFSPDGTRLAIAAEKRSSVWDVTTGRKLLTLTASPIITFNQDGTRIATAGENGAIVWDTATGKQLFNLSHAGFNYGVAFSPDGTRLATAGDTGVAKVWDAVSGQELLTLSGHTSTIGAITFSPDGSRLATAGRDGVAKVWDVTSGRELLALHGSGVGLCCVAFSPDGSRLYTGGDDGVRVYLLRIEDLVALARQRLTRTWMPDECRTFLHMEHCPTP